MRDDHRQACCPVSSSPRQVSKHGGEGPRGALPPQRRTCASSSRTGPPRAGRMRSWRGAPPPGPAGPRRPTAFCAAPRCSCPRWASPARRIRRPPPPSEPPVPGPALRRRHCRVTEAEPRDESTESRCKHVAPWSGSPPRQQILVRPHQLYRRTALDPPVQLCRPLILARGRMSALTLVKAAQSTDDWMLCHSGGRCTWSGWCQR